jgi:superfamily I DNA/RNA helicase
MDEQLEPSWNQEQLSVINAGADERLIVDGGPGTGKTAVLTARIARLIDIDNVAPSNIWVISFTRTAVAELRIRLGMYLKNSEYRLARLVSELRI